MLKNKKNLFIAIASAILILSLIFFQLTTPVATVSKVTRGIAVNAASGNVKVLAAAEYLIKAQYHGRIQEIKIPQASGSLEVKKGDVIAQLDTTDIDREIDNLSHRYEAALKRKNVGSQFEGEKIKAEKELELAEILHRRGEYSEYEFEKRKQELDRMARLYQHESINHDLDVNLIKSELDQKKTFKAKMTLTAPDNGLLTESYFLSGNHVNFNENIAKIISKDVLIEVSINEEDYRGIQIGQAVSIHFLGHGCELAQGKITSLSATANAETKRRNALVQVDSNSSHITPGMTGQASIKKDVHENVLIIPRKALFGNSVFVINNGRAEERKVEPGFMGLDKVEIKNGLYEGDIVITEDVFSFNNGQRVKTKLITQ